MRINVLETEEKSHWGRCGNFTFLSNEKIKKGKILPQISEWIKKYFNRRVWDENTSPLFESHCERRVEVGSNSPSRPWRRRRRWMDGWWMDGRTERAAVMRRWLGAGCIRADGVRDGCGDFTLRWQLTVAERAVSSLDTGSMISWLKSWRDLIGLANTLRRPQSADWRGDAWMRGGGGAFINKHRDSCPDFN